MGNPVTWNEWYFEWDVKDDAGLNLMNVHYKGVKYIHKASLPVIRVKYDDEDTGPYADQIKDDNLAKFTDCDNNKICTSFFTGDGTDWLDIRVGVHIGAYRIQQAWQLGRDGRIAPRVWSRGVHAPINHVHHPYWRIDFDIDGPDNNEVWVVDADDHWAVYTIETAVKKKPGRRWLVRNSKTGRGIWITPGVHDGSADSFSKADLAIRRYHESEDEPWPFGCWGGLGYDDDEGVRGEDIVVWYIAHMFHEASKEQEGSLGEWLSGGPTLEVTRAPRWAGLFSPGPTGHQGFWADISFDELVDHWTNLAQSNVAMSQFQRYVVGGQRKWAGLFSPGPTGQSFWAGISFDELVDHWKELAQSNVAMLQFQTYKEGGQRLWAGLFGPGQTGQSFWRDRSFDELVDLWRGFARNNVAMLQFQTYEEGGQRLWAGLFGPGQTGQGFWAGITFDELVKHWKELAQSNVAMSQFQTYEEGGQRKWAGLFSPGPTGHQGFWAGITFDELVKHWKELAQSNVAMSQFQTYYDI